VLRAAEPALALALAHLMLPASQHPGPARALARVPVVGGAALASVGAHGPSGLGVALACACNCCFALRGILSKRLASAYQTDAWSEWFHLSVLGVAFQGFGLVGLSVATGRPLPVLPTDPALLKALVTAGVSFFAYLQLSWVCLARMTAVSHSLVNSLRRPATIVAALFYAPMALSRLNVFGIGLACAGALLYSLM
jgi:solute carrier family 35 protein E1